MKLSNRSQTISPDFQIEITPNQSYLILEIIPRLKQPKYKTRSSCILYRIDQHCEWKAYGPRQANLVLIAYASSEGSGEPAHPRSLARTSTAHSYKQWIKRNLQTESQIPGPSEWLGMRSWNLSWRNARRHKFAWRGSYGGYLAVMGALICSLPSKNKRKIRTVPCLTGYLLLLLCMSHEFYLNLEWMYLML